MHSRRNGYTILVGEDELEVRAFLEMALKYLGYSVELAQDGEEIISYLRSTRSEISAVLLDLGIPQPDGINVLREIGRIDPGLPVIVVSGTFCAPDVVSAMKTGATDFLCKPIAHDDLRSALTKALESRAARGPGPPPSANPSCGFVGTNARMREIHSLIARVGGSDAPVLIQGETGCGKEVLARELHANSPRSGKVFLKLNCAALPSELVESELFGYEQGAFTGAFQKKAGTFELADGGTILLDEIGDMGFVSQAKLLQVLQDREFQRIGGREVIQVDVRVLAATHRDLDEAISDGSFREDLYYRLNVVDIRLPSLRERKDDIVPLAEYLLKKHAGAGKLVSITGDLKQAMMTYHWPGNVRELENLVRRLLVLRDPGSLARDLFARASSTSLPPSTPQGACACGEPILEQVSRAKQQAEARAILTALHSTHWNRKQAAGLLKIDYKALLYKMKKLGLEE